MPLRKAALALALLAGVVHAAALAERQNFNAGWRFHLGDIGGAEKADVDDHDWQAVGLPHSFGAPSLRAPEVYVGYGWYRKELVLAAVPAGRRWTLEFEGAFQTAVVYVNGAKVACHRGGHAGFPVDLTAALRPGRNVIAVRVDNVWDPAFVPRAGERIASGGIDRDVWLVTANAVRVAPGRRRGHAGHAGHRLE